MKPPAHDHLAAMILRQHDGGMTERERLERAIATAKRQHNKWGALLELLEIERKKKCLDQ